MTPKALSRENQVLHGDCLELMKDIPEKSIDMILCDLPYGTTACKWDTIIPFEPLWEQYKRIIKDNGAIVLTASQPFTSALVMSNPKMFKYEWIWEKSRPSGIAQAKYQPMKKHENIVIFSNGKTLFNHQKEIRQYKGENSNRKVWATCNTGNNHGLNKTQKKIITEKRNPTTVLPFSSLSPFPKGSILHPTQKPVALFEYLIKTYTNEGDLVLDNAAGSGTTAIAARNTGRNYILIEKEQEYIDIINKRLTKENEYESTK